MNRKKFLKWTSLALLIFLISWWIMRHCYFSAEKLLYFNSADSTENVLNSYYIANGWTAFRDFANNHFPGVYLLIGWMFKVLGVQGLDPSLQLAFKSHFYASYSVTLWQVLWYTALFTYIVRVRFLAAALATVLLVYLNNELKVLHVLSETMILPLFSMVPIFLHRVLWHPDNRKRMLAGLFLIFPWSFVSLWLGLTAALSTVCVALGAALALVMCVKDIPATAFSERRKLFFWGSGLVALAAATWASIDIEKMFFFNFPFNKPLAPASGLNTVWAHVVSHFNLDWQGKEWPLGTLVATVAFVLLNLVLTFTAVRKRHAMQGKPLSLIAKVILWIITLSSAAAFLIWRFPYGYKTVALLGLNIGFVAQVLILIRLNFDFTKSLCAVAVSFEGWKYRNHALSLLCALLLFQGWSARERTLGKLRKSIQPLFISMHDYLENHRRFRDAGVCQFRSDFDSACMCMRATNFNAGDFLAYDMRQCKTWGIWIVLIPFDSWSTELFMQDAERKDVGFILTDSNTHKIFGVNESVVSTIKSVRRCQTFNAVEQLCL